MSINRNNYESHFLDYFEGMLDPLQEDELLQFLEKNPDLKEEFESFDIVPLVADPDIHFPDKNLLRKKNIHSVGPINEQNYQEYLIANMEGDLSEASGKLLERFILRNPSVARERALFQATKSRPDPGITYPDKKNLKKYPFWITYRQPISHFTAVAATLLILFLIVNPFGKKETADLAQDKAPVIQSAPASSATDQIKESPLLTGKDEGREETDPSTAIADKIQPAETAPAMVTDPFRKQESMVLASADYLSPVDEPLPSPITPIHTGIRYQIINPAFNPARQLMAEERNLYSQALPYLAGNEQYTLSSSAKDEQGLVAMTASSPWHKLKDVFSGKRDKEKNRPNINLWTLADLGVAGINRLTDSELHIQRIKDEEGRIVSYALINENQEITRTRQKSSPVPDRKFE